MTTDAFMKLLGNEDASANQNAFSRFPKPMLSAFSRNQSNVSIRPKNLQQPLSSISMTKVAKNNMPSKMDSIRITRSFTNLSSCSRDKINET